MAGLSNLSAVWRAALISSLACRASMQYQPLSRRCLNVTWSACGVFVYMLIATLAATRRLRGCKHCSYKFISNTESLSVGERKTMSLWHTLSQARAICFYWGNLSSAVKLEMPTGISVRASRSLYIWLSSRQVRVAVCFIWKTHFHTRT